jgi:formylglycine-generating enzyme required for sulfatase activity
MTIPNENSFTNWKYGIIKNVNGVEFKMIPVTGYSRGFYLIGETEVTMAQYTAVVNGKATTTDPQYPQASKSYDDFNNFIAALNKLTFLNFSLPSKDQWLYAAKGGSKSQNYLYCGSNYPDDVAWYSENSGGTTHPVKQLAPNELGLYDMSGNVGEFTSTSYTGYSYIYYYFGGGSYKSTLSEIQSTSCDTYEGSHVSSAALGFRLILTCE